MHTVRAIAALVKKMAFIVPVLCVAVIVVTAAAAMEQVCLIIGITSLEGSQKNGNAGARGVYESTNTFISVENCPNAYSVYRYLTDAGLTDEVVCAILGNAFSETGGVGSADLNPSAQTGHDFGIWQWTGSGKTRGMEWLSSHGYAWDSLEGQCELLLSELRGQGGANGWNYGNTAKSLVMKGLLSTDYADRNFFLASDDLMMCTAAFLGYYEGPCDLAMSHVWNIEGRQMTQPEYTQWEYDNRTDLAAACYTAFAGSSGKATGSGRVIRGARDQDLYFGGMNADGIMGVPYINQGAGLYTDGVWSHTDWPGTTFSVNGQTLAAAGCGFCCTAMALSYCTGQLIPPTEFMENGMYVAGNGADHHIGVFTASQYGVRTENTTDFKEVIKALQNGCPVMALMRGGTYWTRNGHYVLLVGVTKDGMIAVNDPGHVDHTYTYTKDLTGTGILYTYEQIDEPTNKGTDLRYTIFYPQSGGVKQSGYERVVR